MDREELKRRLRDQSCDNCWFLRKEIDIEARKKLRFCTAEKPKIPIPEGRWCKKWKEFPKMGIVYSPYIVNTGKVSTISKLIAKPTVIKIK